MTNERTAMSNTVTRVVQNVLRPQVASSIARMLVLEYGIVGARRELKIHALNQSIDISFVDCDGNQYQPSRFTTEDFGLLFQYVNKQSARVAQFFGANDIALSVVEGNA